jgi:hypothetical protein
MKSFLMKGIMQISHGAFMKICQHVTGKILQSFGLDSIK